MADIAGTFPQPELLLGVKGDMVEKLDGLVMETVVSIDEGGKAKGKVPVVPKVGG